MEITPPSEPSPMPSRPSWDISDLIAFGSFFVVTLFFLPAVLVLIARVFKPDLSVTNLSGEAQILLQGALDIAWVGFIFFLVRVIHRKKILETFRWHNTHRYRVSSLIALGATLAITVFVVSSFFPPSSPPAVEKLAESSRSVFLLVIFGVCFAPIIEEIIFRGFLFSVLSEFGGSRLAVPATAVLFALMHAPQLWPSLAGIVLIFAVGYVLSIVRERSNSLIPSFIVHTAYNSMLVGASAIGTLLQKGK
jgi:membrane protease YdiL (CAAX protease family)